MPTNEQRLTKERWNRNVYKNRDGQRRKVYNWEPLNIPNYWGDKVSLLEASKMISEVCKDYQIDAPEVVGDGGRGRPCTRGYYRPIFHQIRLPASVRTRAIVLHEATHAIVTLKEGDKEAWHGPKFVSVYIDLLHAYMGLDREELRKSAIAFGLIIGPAGLYTKRRE